MKKLLLYAALCAVVYFVGKWALGEIETWYQRVLDCIFITP